MFWINLKTLFTTNLVKPTCGSSKPNIWNNFLACSIKTKMKKYFKHWKKYLNQLMIHPRKTAEQSKHDLRGYGCSTSFWYWPNLSSRAGQGRLYQLYGLKASGPLTGPGLLAALLAMLCMTLPSALFVFCFYHVLFVCFGGPCSFVSCFTMSCWSFPLARHLLSPVFAHLVPST